MRLNLAQFNLSRPNLAARRASVSVEMALTSLLFLLPLFAGGADFLAVIAVKSKMNAALQAFYAYAWNNPAGATNTTQLASILAQFNGASLPAITFPDGNAGPSTSYQPTLSYRCTAPAATSATTQATPCPTGDAQQTIVTYSLISSVDLPLPLPVGLTSPYSLGATGQVQIQ